MKTARKITCMLCIAVIFTAIAIAPDAHAQEEKTPVRIDVSLDATIETEATDEEKSKLIEGGKKGFNWVKDKTAPAREKAGELYDKHGKKHVDKVLEAGAEEGKKIAKQAGDEMEKRFDSWWDQKMTEIKEGISNFFSDIFRIYKERPPVIFTGRTSTQAFFILYATLLILLILFKTRDEWKRRYVFIAYLTSRLMVLIFFEFPDWESEDLAFFLNIFSFLLAIPLAIYFFVWGRGLSKAHELAGFDGIKCYVRGEPLGLQEEYEGESPEAGEPEAGEPEAGEPEAVLEEDEEETPQIASFDYDEYMDR